MSKFVEEIHTQPDALKMLATAYRQDMSSIRNAANLLSGKESVIFTGMGTSYFAPLLIREKIAPCTKMILIESGELLDTNLALVRDNDPIVIVSQSGESGEIVRLVRELKDRARIIAITNEPDSTLARNSVITLRLHAGTETSITNKTYTNTLAVLNLLAAAMLGGDLDALLAGFRKTADKMDAYLANPSAMERLKACAEFFAPADAIHFISRGGAGLALAYQAALVFMEGAKCQAQGFSSGAFRHGPIELSSYNHRAVIFAPKGKLYEKLITLAENLVEYGSKVVFISNGGYDHSGMNVVPLLTDAEDQFVFLAAVAFEMLLVFTAQERWYVAGESAISQKVTVDD